MQFTQYCLCIHPGELISSRYLVSREHVRCARFAETLYRLVIIAIFIFNIDRTAPQDKVHL